MATTRSIRPHFRILPAGEQDCPAMANVEVLSFSDVRNEPQNNAIFGIMLGPPDEKCIAFRAKSFADRLENPAARFWKAVVDDENEPNGEKIVACALWKFFVKPEKIEDWKPITEWTLDISPDACNEFGPEMTEMRKRHMDEKSYGFLEVFATRPEYRGYGIGSALMETGLAEARKEGLKEFWINASIDGKGLYMKYGFKEADAIRRDISAYGGTGTSNIMGMRMVDL